MVDGGRGEAVDGRRGELDCGGADGDDGKPEADGGWVGAGNVIWMAGGRWRER